MSPCNRATRVTCDEVTGSIRFLCVRVTSCAGMSSLLLLAFGVSSHFSLVMWVIGIWGCYFCGLMRSWEHERRLCRTRIVEREGLIFVNHECSFILLMLGDESFLCFHGFEQF